MTKLHFSISKHNKFNSGCTSCGNFVSGNWSGGTVSYHLRSLSSYDHVAFVLAALAHDVGHPGRNNLFLANTANPLSLIYNDISTLENYHSSLLFHILRCHPEFVNQFGAKDWQNMRKRIVELILATDMRCHFNHVNEIKVTQLCYFDLCDLIHFFVFFSIINV